MSDNHWPIVKDYVPVIAEAIEQYSPARFVRSIAARSFRGNRQNERIFILSQSRHFLCHSTAPGIADVKW